MIEKLAENPNAAALGWLLEMELINNPMVLNSICLNMFKNFPGIKDADFLIDAKAKKILIYVEPTIFGRWFKSDKIKVQVEEMITSILPNFRFRVTLERKIFDLALNLTKSRQNKALGESK